MYRAKKAGSLLRDILNHTIPERWPTNKPLTNHITDTNKKIDRLSDRIDKQNDHLSMVRAKKEARKSKGPLSQ